MGKGLLTIFFHLKPKELIFEVYETGRNRYIEVQA